MAFITASEAQDLIDFTQNLNPEQLEVKYAPVNEAIRAAATVGIWTASFKVFSKNFDQLKDYLEDNDFYVWTSTVDPDSPFYRQAESLEYLPYYVGIFPQQNLAVSWQTFDLTADKGTLIRGTSIIYTVGTEGLEDGDRLYWKLANPSLQGEFTQNVLGGEIVINGNGGDFTLTLKADSTITNGTNLVIQLYRDSARTEFITLGPEVIMNRF